MSSYSDYAANIGRLQQQQGEILARAELAKGAARSNAQSNTAALWGQTIGNLGQIPGQVIAQQAQAKELQLREQEQQLRNQALQGQVKAQEQQRITSQQADEIVSKFPKNPDGTYNVPGIQGELTKIGVPLTQQKSFLDVVEGMNGISKSFAASKVKHSADAAHLLLSTHPKGQPWSWTDVQLSAASFKPIGLVSDEVQQQIDKAAEAQADPEAFLKLLRDQSPEYKDYDKRAAETAKAQSEAQREELITAGTGPTGITAQQQATLNATAATQSATQADRAADNARLAAAAQETARHNLAMEKQSTGGAATPGSTGQLTPEGLDLAASQYRITGVMPPMGMGRTPERFAVLNKAGEQTKLLGQTPATAIQKQYAFKADANALKKLQELSSTSEAAENKAIGQIEIIRDLSPKVPRTQYPFINNALVSGKIELLGDSNAQQLANAIQTFSNEYGKIIEGSTASIAGASDTSRKAAAKLVKASQNEKTLNDVLGLMQREMDLTLSGYGAAIAHVTTQMGGAPAAPAPRVYYDSNGKPVTR